jgi:hypothetical protein
MRPVKADVGRCVSAERTELCLRPVMDERTCPVIKNHLWTLTRSDQTLHGRSVRSGSSTSGLGDWLSRHVGEWMRRWCIRSCWASFGRLLSSSAGIADRWRSAAEVECGDAWHASSDRTLGLVHPVSLTNVSSHPKFSTVRGPMALFIGDPYVNMVASHGSLSWPFLLRIHHSEPSHSSLTHLA